MSWDWLVAADERVRRKPPIHPRPFYSFHQHTKLVPGQQMRAPSELPLSWTRVQYKKYSRYPAVPLPRPETSDKIADYSLIKALNNRRSRQPIPRQFVSDEQLSSLLHFGVGLVQDENENYEGNSSKMISPQRRSYPSAGGRYPIELYVIRDEKNSPSAAGSSVFHYRPIDHALELIRENVPQAKLDESFTEGWISGAPLLFVLTAVFERSAAKYGDTAYRYILLEAGHIGQNICLLGQVLGLDVCPAQAFFDDPLDALLQIDGYYESVLYAFGIGQVAGKNE